MKTETPISLPNNIKFADHQSEVNWKHILLVKPTTGLIVITGEKASGKTRLASTIAGHMNYHTLLPSEHKLSIILDQPTPKVKYFDEIKTKNPIKSRVIQKAIPHKLIIISGLNVELSLELESRALRINLARPTSAYH